LAQIPQFASWPEARRGQHAHQWFLERLLLDDDRQRCAEALWAPKHRELGLPGNTVFRAGAFLSLPTPEDVDAEAAVSASLLTGAPLTDQVVSDGALAYAFEDTAFKLSETQVVAEIARLHAFVADHGAAPKHLDLFGGNRIRLVDLCARMAAGLALRTLDCPAALDPLDNFVALDRYPLRVEPAIPALVRLEILDSERAIVALKALLASADATDSVHCGPTVAIPCSRLRCGRS
jgi:hypothetical protein